MADWKSIVSRAVRAITLVDAEKLSDRDLLERFASHADQFAFTTLVERHGLMVLGVCRRLLGHAHDAEDATQAVFVLLARKAKSGRWHASIANWLHATARQVARNAIRGERRRTRREEVSRAVTEAHCPLDDITGRELLAILDEELERLPSRYREPLILCYLEGLPRDEAATRLGLPIATLKSQLERGKKKLADALSSRGYSLSALLLLASSEGSRASAQLIKSILASISGSPSEAVTALIEGVTMNGFFAKSNLLALLGVGTVLLGIGLAIIQPSSARQRKDDSPKVAEKNIEEPQVEVKENAPVARIGSTRFRAEEKIDEARYSADGKRIVGRTGAILYVWDAQNGTVLNKIDTGLDWTSVEPLELEDADQRFRDWNFCFDLHPESDRVVCGGWRNEKIVLQVWDAKRGERLAEKETPLTYLRRLAWTPDGKRILGQMPRQLHDTNGERISVYDERLAVIRSHDIPSDRFYPNFAIAPHPDNKRFALLSANPLTIFDIETGAVVRKIGPKVDDRLGHSQDHVHGIRFSHDGKTLATFSGAKIAFFDLAAETPPREIAVSTSWRSGRSCLSKDGKSVYVHVHGGSLTAYEVATAKQQWQVASTYDSDFKTSLCDLSPDGATLLVAQRKGLRLFDAKSGMEHGTSDSLCDKTDLIWAPDAKTLFTRTQPRLSGPPDEGSCRWLRLAPCAYTAWEVSTGQPRYRLQPTTESFDGEWQLDSDLFFLRGGKEFLACLAKEAPGANRKAEHPGERRLIKELLVFDTESGRVIRKFGDAPGGKFEKASLIAVDETTSRVVLQDGPMNFPGDGVAKYPTVLWDPIRKVKLKEWVCLGNGFDVPRHFSPYSVQIVIDDPEKLTDPPTTRPCKLRYYSLRDGKLVRQLISEFRVLDADRIQAGLLLTAGHDGGWMMNQRPIIFVPPPFYAHELWELSTGQKARLFETPKKAAPVLAPGAKYLIRVVDDRTFELYEPFVLKKAVRTITTSSRPERFEFSPDGTRLAAAMVDTTIAIWDTTPWQKQIDDELRKHVPQDLTPLWDDLAKEAGTALRASRLLGLAPERAVALLGEKIAARPEPTEATLKRLVSDLDAAEFAARQKADKELRNLSRQAETSLREALKANPSAEAKQRLEAILKEIESGKLTGEECRELRAVAILKAIGSKEATELLARWAKGDPNAALTKAAKE